jgi:hypothetical protein
MTKDKIIYVDKEMSEKIEKELGYLPDNVLVNNFVPKNQAVVTDVLEDMHDTLVKIDYIPPTAENLELIENLRAQMFRALGVPSEYLKPVPKFTSMMDYFSKDLLDRLKEALISGDI